MAVIWQKQVNGKCYEVRSAGETRRLYTDGVFHSQYNPNRTLTANVWDLISLPSFFLSAAHIRRILVLGVGGGAVMQQLRCWYPEAELVGVELDKTHLQIAKRFFGLRGKQIELVCDDAIDWVNRYRGMPFDIIIDDLFTEHDGEPARVIAANQQWMAKLTGLLTAHGMLVMNFTSGRDLRNAAVFSHKPLKQKYPSVFRLMTPLYDNQVGVFLRQTSTTNQWRKAIKQDIQLALEFERYRNKYQLRKLV